MYFGVRAPFLGGDRHQSILVFAGTGDPSHPRSVCMLKEPCLLIPAVTEPYSTIGLTGDGSLSNGTTTDIPVCANSDGASGENCAL